MDGTTFDGWIDEHPFVIGCGWEYKRQLEDMNFDEFRNAWGWPPVDQIAIAAMCNDPEDHVLLAKLCIALARQFEGAIDLGGDLQDLTKAAAAEMPGRLVKLPSFDNGVLIEGFDWYCDAEFLTAWMADSKFRMVK